MKAPFKITMLMAGGLIVASYAFGFLSHKYRLPPSGLLTSVRAWCGEFSGVEGDGRPSRGKWFRSRQREHDLSRETVERLSALGYLSGYEPPTDLVNVTVHVPTLAQRGLSLYNSGHAPEAWIIDMQGNRLHRWRYTFADAFPSYPREVTEPSYQWWRHVHPYRDGGLLAIFEGLGLIRLDRDSNLLWAVAGGFHHDVFVEEDGTIYALTREEKVIERIHDSKPVLEDFILVLDADGEPRRKISLLAAWERSAYAPLLRNMRETGDVFHTNTLNLLDGTIGTQLLFRRGSALISLRNLHAIAVVDLEREEIVWALTGMWAFQHQPTLLPNGNLLLFDNAGAGEMSRVLEIDPLSQSIAWAYRGTEENGFFSATLGDCQRLTNGNTLITESEAGRAFEVTPDLEIVWEYYNPERAGEQGEFIATLFEMVRLPSEFGADWLDSSTQVGGS